MTADFAYKSIAGLVIVGALFVVYKKYEDTRPCAKPIVYSIGTFDVRFGVDRADFLTDLQSATDLWNRAAGETLFTYAAEGGVSVNLVYDTRQANANFGTSLSAAQSAYNAHKLQVDAKVAQYNASPRHSSAEVAALNADIAALNAEARAINANVSTYNAGAGQFEEGEFDSTRGPPFINLYEFTNKTQLERLAAHEFGHALGLEHVEGVSSIMYPVNKSTSLQLSPQDLSALKTLCKL